MEAGKRGRGGEHLKSKAVRVGMLGMGTVGGGVAEILTRNGTLIEKKAGVQVRLEKVLVRDPSRARRVDLAPEVYTISAGTILDNPAIEIVVELIGGIEPARTYIRTALQRGKCVVTANKDLLALHGAELFAAARACGGAIFFEASAGGGIPLIRPLQHSLTANRITCIMGIINGTTNYILTRMDREETEFAEALRAAQEKGFAEADPSNDLEGRDAAYKLAILAGLAFSSPIDVHSIHVEGINGVCPADIRYARELGYAIKLLAVGEDLPQGLALRVHPCMVPLAHPLASVRDEFNAVFLEGDAVGEVMFYGRGAGALPTASAVIADIVDAARSGGTGAVAGINVLGQSGVADKPVLPVSMLRSCFYLRLQATDRPGVFAALATAFGDEAVSLDLIIQKGSTGQSAEIVLVTHSVLEERFFRALDRIRKLDTLRAVHSVFRVIE